MNSKLYLWLHDGEIPADLRPYASRLFQLTGGAMIYVEVVNVPEALQAIHEDLCEEFCASLVEQVLDLPKVQPEFYLWLHDGCVPKDLAPYLQKLVRLQDDKVYAVFVNLAQPLVELYQDIFDYVELKYIDQTFTLAHPEVSLEITHLDLDEVTALLCSECGKPLTILEVKRIYWHLTDPGIRDCSDGPVQCCNACWVATDVPSALLPGLYAAATVQQGNPNGVCTRCQGTGYVGMYDDPCPDCQEDH